MANRFKPTILFIDPTEFNLIKLCLFRKNRISAFEKKITFEQRDDLLKTIKLFLDENKIKLADLTQLGVIKGPGPFTAIRIGITLTNTLGLTLKIPIYGIKKIKTINYHLISDKILFGQLKPEKNIIPYYNQPPNITQPKNKIACQNIKKIIK